MASFDFPVDANFRFTICYAKTCQVQLILYEELSEDGCCDLLRVMLPDRPAHATTTGVLSTLDQL